MENAVEAFKIAGSVILFVIALSLSISSLSTANTAVSEITSMYDKEANYTYIKPSSDLSRTVGIDTIIPTMYNAYEENIKIVFKDKNGEDIPIYYKTNQYGSRVDEEGKSISNSSEGTAVTVTCIDLSEEGFSAATDAATNHLSMILAGATKWKKQWNDSDAENKQEMLDMLDAKKYGNQFMDGNNGSADRYPNGFYEYLAKHTFSEQLGEYYQGSDSTKIKKRVIVYKMKN